MSQDSSFQTETGTRTLKHPRLAPAWVGFLLVALYVAAGVYEAQPGAPQYGLRVWAWLLTLTYWLYCVYRINSALRVATNNAHPIIPSQSVTFHFVPIYNIYWVFRWTNAVGAFLRSRSQTYARGEAGACILFAAVLGKVEPVLGLLALFAFITWFTSRISKALQAPTQRLAV